MSNQIFYVVSFLATVLITALAARWLIPKLKSKKMGQKILDIGPRWHKGKEGTPVMGGLSFIFAITIVGAIAIPVGLHFDIIQNVGWLLIVYFFALANGLIGVIDDLAKLSKGKNQGLRAWQKYGLQLIAAGAFLFVTSSIGYITTELYLPFVDITLSLGIFYYVVMLLLLTGLPNATNLTDGVDGLSSSVTLVVASFFAVVGLLFAGSEVTLISVLLAGGCIGFLIYNFYPARVFMGDTGSLFLGGIVVGIAFMLDNPLIIIVVGIIYIIETVSVMMQVSYFKLTKSINGTGKRLFLMTPIHHHFEMKKWSEVKIVFVFSTMTVIAAGVAYLGLR